MPTKDKNKAKLYNARWYQKNKAKCKEAALVRRAKLQVAVDQIKLDSGCIDCGYNEHPRALDFDHIGSNKVFNVSAMVSHGYCFEKVLEEIAKCEVRCANCHRIRTHERKQN